MVRRKRYHTSRKFCNNIEEVYSLIGLKKQYLVYWSKNPQSVQTKKLQVKNNLYCCRSI